MDAEQARKSDLWAATDVEVTQVEGVKAVTLTVSTTVLIGDEPLTSTELLRVVAAVAEQRMPTLISVVRVKLDEALA